jgi:hypothetical protein
MDPGTRELVRQRAGLRREYCHLPENLVPYLVYHVDHIVAKQHLDEVSDDPELLAWACSECNYHKGPNLVSIDPHTKQTAVLFKPAHGRLARPLHHRRWANRRPYAVRPSHVASTEHERLSPRSIAA